MLSSKAKYAARAALYLAAHARGGVWARASEVAEKQAIPRKFLETIMVQLRDSGIVESRRGAQGGYRLLRDSARISLADIIRVVDGPLALTPCASRTRFRPCTDCVDAGNCRLRPVMRQARDAVAAVLEQCSLATLAVSAPRPRRAGKGAGKRNARRRVPG
jgi:Rrf2 family protein